MASRSARLRPLAPRTSLDISRGVPPTQAAAKPGSEVLAIVRIRRSEVNSPHVPFLTSTLHLEVSTLRLFDAPTLCLALLEDGLQLLPLVTRSTHGRQV